MNYLENLVIYFSNLSYFYIFSVVTSVAIVLLTIYMGAGSCLKNAAAEREEKCSESAQKRSVALSDTDEDGDSSDTSDMRIESVRQLKSAKLRSLEDSLTEEQKEVEKEIEKVQLAAIYSLLKKQNEEFCINSNLDEDELQEQLNLYR
ncbi:uncharacterized protein LOC128737673 [Sabethes cyaneus]|uniref:uncharacterized protein LOC128737673 n=1 Tax=Sabethes cyaneus TaxID=53552 RepID=UPI00237EDC58|nr:uncharacterized protein LOC128737673 [Sabethes cyaneus]